MNVVSLGEFVGQYSGEGMWIDVTGESKRYRVRQHVTQEDNRLLVTYTHDFFEEGNTTSGEFVFEFVHETICTVTMKGMAVGNGYRFGPYFHFNIQVGEIFVETSYTATDKQIEVRGSSTKNAQGNFIGWHELLQKETVG